MVGARALRAEQRMQVPLLVAAALTLPAVILGEVHSAGTVKTVAVALNWGTWLAFLIELLVMLALVPNRWRYLRNHPLEIAVVVLTPPVLPASLQGLRAVRIFRLLRLLRLLKFAQASHRVFSNEGLGYTALTSLLIAVTGGLLFRAFEGSHQSLTEWEGFYWAVSSMTTLGSQYEPHTTGSEIVSMTVQLVGISFMAVLTGALAGKFLNSSRSEAPVRDRTDDGQ